MYSTFRFRYVSMNVILFKTLKKKTHMERLFWQVFPILLYDAKKNAPKQIHLQEINTLPLSTKKIYLTSIK